MRYVGAVSEVLTPHPALISFHEAFAPGPAPFSGSS